MAITVQILKNALICGGGHIVTVLSLLITTPLLLHKLGKEGMGVIILAKSILGMSGMMAFGMGQATLRYVSKYRAREDHARLSDVLSTTLTFYAILGLALPPHCCSLWPGLWSPGLFDFEPKLFEEAVFAFRVGAVGLFGALMAESVSSALKGFERFDLAVPIDVGTRLILLVGQVLLLTLGFRHSQS